MRGILFISNFLSNKVGTRSVAEDLSEHFYNNSWQIYTTSHYLRRVPRLIDMVSATIRFRHYYQVAYVEVYSGQAFIWAEIISFLLRKLKKTYVLSLHGGGLPDFANRWPDRVFRLLAPADQVTTPSRYLQEQLTSLRQDIIYIPNAITISNYPLRWRDQPTPELCWLRAFHSIYDPELAVQTLALLVSAFPDISLTMIGPDKHDGSFQSVSDLANRLEVTNHLKIVGRVAKSAVPAWLDRGEIFLNTTRFESFGVSVLEAAACGLPIVSTNVGELPYFWEDGRELLLVPVSDPRAMADAVRKYLNTPSLAKQMSVKARKKAEMHDWSYIFPQWENLFMNLASM